MKGGLGRPRNTRAARLPHPGSSLAFLGSPRPASLRRSVRMSPMKRRVVLQALVLGLLVAPLAGQATLQPVFPAAQWEYVRNADREAYGWSPSGLDKAFAFVRDSTWT